MYLLDNVIQKYDWGSRTAIAELQGRMAPTQTPEAELWMGAHPSGSSRVRRGAELISLARAIADNPEQWLGARAVQAFGPNLPFLFKVLAAERPLSLQAHPNDEQAQQGFEAEEAANIPRESLSRNYRDARAKPELLCALSRFEALLGFRPAAQIVALFRELDVSELTTDIDEVANANGSNGIGQLFGRLITLPAAQQAKVVRATMAACQRAAEQARFAAAYRWAARLGHAYPSDIGVVIAMMMNLVVLEPGEAIYVPAGMLHAYLHGVGVEIMANSDNVLRGGLTSKHVDAGELRRVLRFDGDAPIKAAFGERGAERIYETPATPFRLSRVTLENDTWTTPGRCGPEILLCVEGRVGVASHDAPTQELARGESAFVPASTGVFSLTGHAVVFRATVGEPERSVASGHENLASQER